MAKQDAKELAGGNQEQNTVVGNRLMKLVRALLKIREQCLMKPDESTYKILQVPILTSNQMSLMNRDDYYR